MTLGVEIVTAGNIQSSIWPNGNWQRSHGCIMAAFYIILGIMSQIGNPGYSDTAGLFVQRPDVWRRNGELSFPRIIQRSEGNEPADRRQAVLHGRMQANEELLD